MSDSDAGPGGTDETTGRRAPLGDERRILSLWKSGMVSQDPRFENKALLKLVAIAMINEDFRSRLLSDAESVINEFPSRESLPKQVKIEFFESTQDTLRVPLPALNGGLNDRIPGFRDRLRSRTSADSSAFFLDDFDIGDWDDHGGFDNGGGADHGDPDTRDSSNSAIVLPE